MTRSSQRRSRTSTAGCAPRSANASGTGSGSPKLAAGDSLALPPEAVAYLDRMRELGFRERLIEIERDSWILIAAQMPDEVPAFMAIKHAQIEHETLRRLYLDIGDLADCAPDDPRLPSLADRVAAFIEAAAAEAAGVEDEQPDQRRPGRAARRSVPRVLPLRAAPARAPRGARLDRLDQHQAHRPDPCMIRPLA